MTETPILDASTKWMIANNVPITLRNWLALNYWRNVKLSDLSAEEIAEIPLYLLPKTYQSGDGPTRKGKLLAIRRQR